MPGVSRRLLVGVLGGGALAAPVVAEALAGRDGKGRAAVPDRAALREAEDLLRPLAPGSRFGRWTVAAIEPLERGAVTVVVRDDDGHDFRLEILARDPSPLAPRPPAQTRRFAIHVQNGGNGWAPTVEEQGLAAMTLARFVERNEATATAGGFLTHAERLVRHGDALTGDPTAAASSRAG